MKRRNFLAYLPSVSAIPLIGTDIISTPEKVEIIKPTPIEVEQVRNNTINDFDWKKAVVKIEYNGATISEGMLTSISREAPSVYGDYITGFREMGVNRITIEAEMFNITRL